MIDWKIIATVLVTLLALLAALGNHPAVRGFFGSVAEKIALPAPDIVNRSVPFDITLDERDGLAFEAKRNVNITVNASEILSVTSDANLTIMNKELRVVGYRGLVLVNGSSIEINGTFERFETSDLTFFVRGSVYSRGTFRSARIDDVSLPSYSTNSSGTAVIDGSEIKFPGEMSIESPLADFAFNGGLEITGKAKKVTIGKIIIS